jgi:hypothetical protein
MINSFIPTLLYCSLKINTSKSKTIYIFLCGNGYCLSNDEEEEISQTPEEFSINIEKYFENHEIEIHSIELKGPKPMYASSFIYKKNNKI